MPHACSANLKMTVPSEQFSKADPRQTVVTPSSTVHSNTASYPGQVHEAIILNSVSSEESI